jgi:hypothetical protein
MEEFEQSLSKMMTGDMTLVSELGAAQLAIQAAIRQANPSDTKQMFSNKEASGMRRRLATLEEDLKLGKISSEDHKAQAVDVLKGLEKLGEILSVGEKSMIESCNSGGNAYSAATENIGKPNTQHVPCFVFFCCTFLIYNPYHRLIGNEDGNHSNCKDFRRRTLVRGSHRSQEEICCTIATSPSPQLMAA